ncbi:MAG TPA: GNAT family N-acetyltransferase [Phycisphaerae bacterium]|nr:GNAT family N-acetyltransferase [Phycisphaerae bacterium]
MTTTRATINDAAAILDLQRLAYQSEAARYDDYAIPPLTETLAELRAQFGSRTFLVAVEEGCIVGSVRGHLQGATCHVERLIVSPAFQRRGIGTELLKRIESEFPTARRFELFTGHRSDGNIRLYERLGYRSFRQERVSEKLTLVFMEKGR